MEEGGDIYKTNTPLGIFGYQNLCERHSYTILVLSILPGGQRICLKPHNTLPHPSTANEKKLFTFLTKLFLLKFRILMKILDTVSLE